MGTRADFYICRETTNKDDDSINAPLEWLGSIAWDGYPAEIPPRILVAANLENFKTDVRNMLMLREDGTLPKDGWPWPWDDSDITDYVYVFNEYTGSVHVKSCGDEWVEYGTYVIFDGKMKLPDMKDKKNVAFDNRSGLIIIKGKE